MKYLKNKILTLVIGLTFSMHVNSAADNLSLLSSNLHSLTNYSSLLKPTVTPVIKPPIEVKPIKPAIPSKPEKLVPLNPSETPITKITPLPHPTPKPISTKKRKTIIRKDFFSDVVGMDEQSFRTQYGWQKDNGNDWGKLANHPQNRVQWINEYHRRAAIFQGEFNAYTPQKINQLIGTEILTHQPYFRIIIHNPGNPEQTDIRALQADPELKHANFQLASTFFGPLEGGMYRWQNSLEGMLERPVQGEEASIAAAPATIFRKYFMQPIFLLEGIKHKFVLKQGRFGPYIDADNYQFDPTDMDKVMIGIHKNIVVTSGYGIGNSGPNGRPGKNDSQERLPVTVLNDKVNTKETQIIHQIFTAAIDLGRAYKTYGTNPLPQNIVNASRMILNGMYKGAIGAPLITKNPVIFLTLLGAGAFLNDPAWIYEAIEQHKDFIKERGLQVTLIYRPDPRKATRDVKKDLSFLRKMFELADDINEANPTKAGGPFDIALQDYLHEAYSSNPDTAKQAYLASQLNDKINGALPSYAPKIKLNPTYVPSLIPSGKTDKPAKPTTLGTFELITTLKNGNKLGWTAVGNHAVLTNINPSTSSYIYVAPGYPGQALPNGLYYWKSQGLNPADIGNHKNVFVKNNPKAKNYIYSPTQKAYVDSHKKDIIWDASKHKKDPF